MSRIAVLLPCHNEESAIADVIFCVRSTVPSADIYVYDNRSTDKTADVARQAGAIVRQEPIKGKGNVVRRMFGEVEADIYVLMDGDGTYDIASIPRMIQALTENNVEMVIGSRMENYKVVNHRTGHNFGNKMISVLLSKLFRTQLVDVLSGYRVMSRRFVKTCPIFARHFEVEVMLTIHALEIYAPTREEITTYSARIAGTESKLRTYRDGMHILATIFYLLKEARPFLFFNSLAMVLFALCLALGTPVILEYLATGLVPRFPTAILASGLGLMSSICLTAGLILDSVSRGRRELKRIAFQSLPDSRVATSEASPD